MSLSLQQIENAVSLWNTIRWEPQNAINYLNQGCFLEITRTMYDTWKENSPETIHAYLGVHDNQMMFFLIDSDKDKESTPLSVENITECTYMDTLSLENIIPDFGSIGMTEITEMQGLRRSFRWLLQRNAWVEKYAASPPLEPIFTEGIFQVFNIPMSDLDYLFGTEPIMANEKALVLFGMREDEKVEFILWGDTFVLDGMLADVSFPVPPFTPSNGMSHYHLLTASGAAQKTHA